MRAYLILLFTIAIACGDDESAPPMTEQQGSDLRIEMVVPPDGRVGDSYELSIRATGGSGANYIWSVVSGNMPPGLALEPTGTPATTISGIPTVAATYGLRIQVQDDSDGRATLDIRLQIEPPGLRITTEMLAFGAVDQLYEAALDAQGGTGEDFRWTIAQGDLPPGITLAASGTPTTNLVGRPTQAGEFSFTVRVEDSAGGSAVQNLMITVRASPLPLLITTSSPLPPGAEDEPYEVTIRAEGGSETSYRWSVVMGALPTGTILASVGTPETTISGTPQAAGTFDFTLQVEDSLGNVTTRAFAATIAAGPQPVGIVTGTMLPNGFVDQSYSTSVTAEGGTPPYAWTVSQGSLPPGLILNSDGMSARIAGTPIQVGSFEFRLRVQDNDGFDERAFTITVVDVAVPGLDILPLTVPNAQVDVLYVAPNNAPVVLEAFGGVGVNRTWSITTGALPPGLMLTPTGARATISGIPSMAGIYNFRVQVEDEVGDRAMRSYSITVSP